MSPVRFGCGRDGRDLPVDADVWTYFTFVQFALASAEQVEQDARDAAGVSGHPLSAVWFCLEHVGLAQPRAALHWTTALEQIRAAVGTDPAAEPGPGA